ncbi:major facilitator superfamily domain-containing protein 4A-like [Mercenaria mercenaria]|uniref:major facilitator superfamily domain-containing protein 4A-like n=1 Tax=Mercenaria mercenaria TaxID=6596 RepID=UPI00234F1E4E|nr:major facilitator superfamily domain-containing protein 4A-like [Mercenaria mercenaria]
MGQHVTLRHICQTFMIFMAWVTKGLYLEVSGPAMIDLKLIYNTNYESITRSVAGRGAGGFLGALIGALIVDKFERQLDLCIAIGTTIAGICIALIPHVPTTGHVWMLYFMIGCVSNAVNMGGTRIALEIWKERSSIVLQLLHMGFGVGALTDPLICSPFLAVIENVQKDDMNPNPHYHVIKESRAHLAFLIIGIFTCCVAIPFFLFQLTAKRSTVVKETVPSTSAKAKSFKEIFNPATYANGNFYYGLCALILLFFIFFQCCRWRKTFCNICKNYFRRRFPS